MVWHRDTKRIQVDREISKNKIQNKKRSSWIRWSLIAVGIIVAFWFLRKAITPKISSKDVVVATVQEGYLENSFSARGTVKPASEIVLTAPLSTQIKEVLIESGTNVKRGDRIIRLNDEESSLEYRKLEDELSLKQNNVSRLQLTLQKNIRDIELDNKIQDLEIKSLRAKLEDAKRLFEISGTTQEDVEQAQQNLDIAILQKQKLENELKFRNASYEADVYNEELQSSIQKNVLNQLGSKIRKTIVISPVNGVLTWINDEVGSQVSEGAPVARISNLSSYYIEGTASDRYSEQLKIGDPVNVRINRDYLNGYVEQILPSVQNNSITFRVALEQPDSDLLKNNMTVELFVVMDEIENTTYVERGSGYKGGKVQDMYVVEGDKLVKKSIEFGITNLNNVEIINGALPGDRIVISDMAEYQGRNSIPLKDIEQ